MPEIEIRPAHEDDIPDLIKIDHNYSSDYVWQIDIQNSRYEGNINIEFRQACLPRPIQVAYPKSPQSLLEDWTLRSGILVAIYHQIKVGYISLQLNKIPKTTWVSDLVVDNFYRRKGIGTALILAAFEWANQFETSNLILEMQPKNYPAFKLAQKLGFEFNGFCNRYYMNKDIGLFFQKAI